MFLFITLILAIMLIIVFVALSLAIGGTIAILCYGDIIICVLIIALIIKKIFFNKK